MLIHKERVYVFEILEAAANKFTMKTKYYLIAFTIRKFYEAILV